MNIIELVIDENEELFGIEAISVVENPAIEEDFIALKNQDQIRLAEVSKEKRLLIGQLVYLVVCCLNDRQNIPLLRSREFSAL